jgi:hypothetical protein
MPRAYAPNLKTIWLVNDLSRALAAASPGIPTKVRLLPPSAPVGNKRVEITIGTETRRATLAEARQIVEELKA